MATAFASLSSSALTVGTTLVASVFATEVCALTTRTSLRAAAAKGQFPCVMAILAFELSHFIHFDFASFDPQYLAQNQCGGGFLSRAVDNPAKRLTRHVHRCRGLFMIEAVEVRQPQRFKLIQRQHNLFHEPRGNARRFEDGTCRFLADSTTALRPRHTATSFHVYWLYYGHMLIICQVPALPANTQRTYTYSG